MYEHKVTVTVAKDQPIDYTHPFPVKIGNNIEERWSTKPRPPKGYAAMLRALGCQRNRDYEIRVNSKVHGIDYFFEEETKAFLFKMAIGHNVDASSSANLKQCCPKCNHTFTPTAKTTV